mgnify:FL=1
MAYLVRNKFLLYINVVLKKVDFPSNFTHFQIKFIEGGLYSAIMDWTVSYPSRSPKEVAKELLDVSIRSEL